MGDPRRHLAERGERARALELLVGLGELPTQPRDLALQLDVRALQPRRRLVEGLHQLAEIFDLQLAGARLDRVHRGRHPR